MTEDGRRAAATCTECGAIGIVRVRPDDRLDPVGQTSLRDCGADALRLLEGDVDATDEANRDDRSPQ